MVWSPEDEGNANVLQAADLVKRRAGWDDVEAGASEDAPGDNPAEKTPEETPEEEPEPDEPERTVP